MSAPPAAGQAGGGIRGAAAFREGAAQVRQRFGVPVSYEAQRTPDFYRANGLPVPRGGSWHMSGEAFDVKVDPNSEKGRAIAAWLRSQGFGLLTEAHGTGPHIHASPNGR